MDRDELLTRIAARPHNVRFEEFCSLIEAFDFHLERVRGSHRIYHREGLSSVVNIQNERGKAKPYQVRQFLKLVERYNLR